MGHANEFLLNREKCLKDAVIFSFCLKIELFEQLSCYAENESLPV